MITFEFRTIEDVKAAHRGYFFSKGANQFFQSRTVDQVFPTADGGALFITSERHGSEPRKWTVRSISQDGDINTIGEPGAYATAAQAKDIASRLASVTSTVRSEQ